MTDWTFVVGLLLLTLITQLTSTAFAASCYRSFTAAEFPNCKLLSSSYALHWKVDQAAGYITLALDVDGSRGWVAFGISEAGGMRGADIMVARKDPETGVFTGEDYYSKDFVVPQLDESQDVTLVSAVQQSGYTTAVFRRKLSTCDTNNDLRCGK